MSSNLYNMKPMVKPLKGGSVYSNVGVFETVSTNTLYIDSLNVEGVFEDGILIDVIIRDSNIYNTAIGLEGPAAASFTNLQTQGDLKFLSIDPGRYVEWDINTGIFKITSDLRVEGCSQLGNLEICNNNIKAVNFNGDINLIPDNLGTIYLRGPVFNDITSGNFYSNAKNGNMSLGGATAVNIFSTSGTINVSSFLGQNYSSINGDITLTTDTGLSNKSILTITPTIGNVGSPTVSSILVTTFANHDLKLGDIITINGNASPLLNTNWTVGDIISTKSFFLNTTTTIGSTFTGGSLLRNNLTNINLNASSLVKIPENIKLTFGQTCNSISGSTSGLAIQSCNNIFLSSGNIYIPQQSRLNFSSTGNWIQYDTTFNLFGTSGINLIAPTVQILSTNTRFYDPIITIGDYTPPVNDIKDRGVEFYYWSSTGSVKTGWFGYKTNTGKFTFLTNVTNTNETVTGSIGNFEIGAITTTELTISGGGLDMNCGDIINVKSLNGCSNNLTISGSTNVTINATNRLGLISGTDIYVPNNIPIKLGSTGSSIVESSTANLVISASKNTVLSTESRGSIQIPIETTLSFDGTSVGSQRIVSNTVGELIVATNKNLYLTTTGGNIIVPTSTQIHFGNSSQNISGNSSGIRLITGSTASSLAFISNSSVSISSSTGEIVLTTLSGDVDLLPGAGAAVRIPQDRLLVFNTSGSVNSITNSGGIFLVTGNGNSTGILRTTSFDRIDLFANSTINIPIGTQIRLGTDGNRYLTGDNSSGVSLINTNTAGNFTISARTTNIVSTGGAINLSTQLTNISGSNFSIIGDSGSLTRINTENTRIKDPIITIADYNNITDDGLDRGIEYRYTTTGTGVTTGSTKLGWFGRKNTTGRFTFFSDAINTSEIITGTLGDLEVSSAFIRNNLTFVNNGNIDLSCGTIANVSLLTGCGGTLNVKSNLGLNISAGNTSIYTGIFNINATNSIRVPSDIPIIFGTGTNIISDSVGNLLLNASQKIVLNADVQINGTTSSVYSTVTNVQDPIISLGGITGPVVNDLKDRGIEFKWSDGVTSKVGFFGYKNNLGRFVFIRDGINNNEIFSGAYGDIQFGNGYFTNLDVGNGNISSVSQISGGQIAIRSTSGNILIQPTSGSSTIFPYNSKIALGDTATSISSNTSGVLSIISKDSTNFVSPGTISISSSTGVTFDGNVPIYIGGTVGTYIIKDTSGNLLIQNSDGNISLTPKFSTGNVSIPTQTYLAFGTTANSVSSFDNKLILQGYNGINLNSSTVTIAGDLNIIGSVTSTATDFDINKYILPLGTYQLLNVNSITNWTNGSGNVKIGVTTPHYFTVGDTITLRNSNSIPKIDGTYTINSVINSTEFTVTSITPVTTSGFSGTIKSNIMLPQDKDVGIEVDYWSTTGNINATSGSIGFKSGFFGFKSATETWNFYRQATISNNVVTGILGDIVVNKVNTERISGFGLDGTMSAGSNLITGTNIQIGGGSINNVPIGASVGSTGRFTTLTNTVSASFTNVGLGGTLSYGCERYTLSSTGLQTRNPSVNVIVSMFSVNGVSWTTSTGTMSSLSVPDGTLKTLICSAMGDNCIHTIFFGEDKLIAPNSLAATPKASRLVFKRRGQSVNLIFDAVLGAWVIIGGSGAYVV